MSQPFTRVLAIDPSPRGFGFAVFEQPFDLIESGFRHVREEKNIGVISQVEQILRRSRPQTLVLEDIDAPASRRQPRVRQLLESLAGLARSQGIAVRRVPRSAVLARFAPEGGKTTKQAVAEKLAEHFPELKDLLPPPRKIWQAERDKLAIFDAVAFAVTDATA